MLEAVPEVKRGTSLLLSATWPRCCRQVAGAGAARGGQKAPAGKALKPYTELLTARAQGEGGNMKSACTPWQGSALWLATTVDREWFENILGW